MSYHYDQPPMRVPDAMAERNALYVILREYLSHEEIMLKMQEVFSNRYNPKDKCLHKLL